MSCTTDNITICLKGKEQADILKKIWEEIFDSEFPGNFGEFFGKYSAIIEAEPLFTRDDTGRNAVTVLLMKYIEKCNDTAFTCNYDQLYDNCGAEFLTKYRFENNKLTIEMISAESEAVWVCADCEDDFFDEGLEEENDPLFTLDEYDPMKEYTCPVCGCNMREADEEADIFSKRMPEYIKYELKFEDSQWILPKGFEIPTDIGKLYDGGEDYDEFDYDEDEDYDDFEFDFKPKFQIDNLPVIISIEGTEREGRNERIEHVKAGDKLILKADFDNEYYYPVAIEVFNSDNQSLGYLRELYEAPLKSIADILDEIDAYAESVTPLSARRKNAKYALMDVKLVPKE